MPIKRKKKTVRRLLLAAGLTAASPFATAGEAGVASPGKTAGKTESMAALAGLLQAARDRKQTGPEVALRNSVYLRSRPTSDAAKANLLPAGTIVRECKNKVVNAAGAWRHIETLQGDHGWLFESDLED
jgi:hypothetical protein